MVLKNSQDFKRSNFMASSAPISKINKLTLIVIFIVVLILTASAGADNIHLFRIGTSGQTGVYYPLGKIITQGITSDNISIGETEENGIQIHPGEKKYYQKYPKRFNASQLQ